MKGNDYDDILKKIEKESADAKKAKAYRILVEQKAPQPQTASGFFRGINSIFASQKSRLLKLWRVKENQHIVLMTAFVLGTCYLSWLIEDKYDQMRKKASKTMTYKQEIVQKENQYINRMLEKTQFEPVPIGKQPQEIERTYHYQKRQDDGIDFDTRADLLEAMETERTRRQSR